MDARVMNQPLVSVVIATHDRLEFLRQALASVAAQTYQHFEVLVIDDASVNDPSLMVATFGERFRCIRQPHGWASAARNRGISAAKGDLIAFLDDDDLWHPERIALTVAALQLRPECGWCICHGSYLLPDGTRHAAEPLSTAQRPLLDTLMRDNPILSPSVLIRRSLSEKSGGFVVDERVRFGEDWHFWTTCAALSPCAIVDADLVAVRRHPGNVSQQSSTGLLTQAQSMAYLTHLLCVRFGKSLPAREEQILFRQYRYLAINGLHISAARVTANLAWMAIRALPWAPSGWVILFCAWLPGKKFFSQLIPVIARVKRRFIPATPGKKI
jgi:glycosyltransferase involved in cell wall biosynthesis